MAQFERKLAVRDTNDIGITLHYNGRNYKATSPHGVLDPQPYGTELDNMAKNPVYKYVGIDEKDGSARVLGSGNDVAPPLEEMRRSIENQRIVRGKPNFRDPELSSVHTKNAKPMPEQEKPRMGTTASGLPNPGELQASQARAEDVMSTARPKVLDVSNDAAAKAPTGVQVEPRSAKQNVQKAFTEPESAPQPVDGLAAFAGAMEEIERATITDPDLLAEGGPPANPPPDEDEDPFAAAVAELDEKNSTLEGDYSTWPEKALRAEAVRLKIKGAESLTKPMLLKQLKRFADD